MNSIGGLCGWSKDANSKRGEIARLCVSDTIELWIQANGIEAQLGGLLWIGLIGHGRWSQNQVTIKSFRGDRQLMTKKCFDM